MAGAVEWSISQKDIDRITKRAERFRGLPLQKRMAKGTLLAAQSLVRPIRAATPKGPTGNLRRSVRARQAKKRIGFRQYAPTLGAYVGPTSPHRHLVIRGHRIVTRGGRDTGQRAKANPYLDRVVRQHGRAAFAIVSKALFER